jgi:hypothetical protein
VLIILCHGFVQSGKLRDHEANDTLANAVSVTSNLSETQWSVTSNLSKCEAIATPQPYFAMRNIPTQLSQVR